MNNKVSIIVPVKTATEVFAKHIQTLLAIDYPDFDIIIVDDGTQELAQELGPLVEEYKGKIRVLKSNGQGPSFCRNLAVRETNADYIAFTDSDCLVNPQWLRQLLKGFEEFPQAVACGGAQDMPFDAGLFEKKVFSFLKKAGLLAEYVKKDKLKLSEVNHNASCNVMYKRNAFLAYGGFLQGLWPGEDVELDYRLKKAGQCLVYNPQAVVYHYRSKNIKAFCSMMYRYGLVQAILVKKYGFFRKVQMAPLLSISLLALLGALFLINKAIALSLAIVLLILFFVYFFDAIVVFLAAMAGICWHWGFLMGLLKKQKMR